MAKKFTKVAKLLGKALRTQTLITIGLFMVLHGVTIILWTLSAGSGQPFSYPFLAVSKGASGLSLAIFPFVMAYLLDVG